MPANKPLILSGNNVSSRIRAAIGAQETSTPISASIGQFDSGEPFVELFRDQESDYQKHVSQLKEASATIVQSTDQPVSEHCQHLLLMAHSLKRYGAKEVIAVMPFAAFARQDRQAKNRFTSVAAEFFPKQLKAAGVDKVVTITPHSQAAVQYYQNEFGNHFTALSTTPLFAEDIKQRFGHDLDNVVIGAPDGADKPLDAGQLRAKELISAVFGEEATPGRIFKISKVHTGVSDTKITGFEGNVEGKHCIIVDDMIDGGSTMINAASLLKSRGAASVSAYATHGIFSHNALEKILSTKPDGITPAIDTLIVTDTIPSVERKITQLAEKKPSMAKRIEVLSADTLIAGEIQRQHTLTAGFTGAARPKSSVRGLP